MMTMMAETCQPHSLSLFAKADNLVCQKYSSHVLCVCQQQCPHVMLVAVLTPIFSCNLATIKCAAVLVASSWNGNHLISNHALSE